MDRMHAYTDLHVCTCAYACVFYQLHRPVNERGRGGIRTRVGGTGARRGFPRIFAEKGDMAPLK